MFKFIHAADIHLDSPLRGLMHFEGAPVSRIQSATREAFCNLVQLAVAERVAFVLIAGDLWDCEWSDSAPALFFIQQAVRLGKAGIPIYIVKGNHDAESKLTGSIRHWPDNVKFLNHKTPQTIVIEHLNVAIHGQSYAQQQVTEDLSACYPRPVPGAFNIGMLHTCLEDGTDYAPVSIDKLVQSGYEYWALGHIHQRQDLSRGGVLIEFPGNLQGRSMREAGPKGCLLVTVGNDHSVKSRFEPLDAVRWQRVSVQSDDLGLEGAVRKALQRGIADAEDRMLAVRLEVIGSVGNGQRLRDRMDALAVEVGDIWLERVLVSPLQDTGSFLEKLGRPAPLALEIRDLIASLTKDESEISEWMEYFSELRGRFVGELGFGESAQLLNKKSAFQALVEKVGGQL
jgi:DNA repair exonuclease SbcCD nuclease subunit